jgi:hypothetical protein
MEILVLDESYEQEIIDLVKKKKKFSHQLLTDEVLTTLQLGIRKSLKNKLKNRIVGCVDNGKLTAVVSQSFDNNYPCWYMDYFISDDDSLTFSNGHGNSINACLLFAMQDAETRGFLDIYYSVPIQYLRTQQKTHPSSPAWSRYDIHIERIIPPNKFPMIEVHKAVYGSVLKPHSVVIKRATLKDDLRKPLLAELK